MLNVRYRVTSAETQKLVKTEAAKNGMSVADFIGGLIESAVLPKQSSRGKSHE